MTSTTVREKIIAHIAKTGRCPNFATVGTDYHTGQTIFEELFEAGVLVVETKTSPTGRKSSVIRLANASNGEG